MLSKKRAEQQIKFQVGFLKFARFYYWYLLLFFGSFSVKMAAKSVALTSTEPMPLYYAINTIKIVGSGCFFWAFQGTTLGSLLSHYEAIASCQFLSNSLNDLTDQVHGLFAGRKWKKMQNEKHLTKRVKSISKSYGKLLVRQCQLDKQFGQSLHFVTVILLFCLAYPAALIFDLNEDKRKAVLFSFNYLALNIFLFTIVIFNCKFLHSNQNFVRTLFRLTRFGRPSVSLKLLQIHQLNHEPTIYSFTYNRLFSFTSSFYFSVGTEHTVRHMTTPYHNAI